MITLDMAHKRTSVSLDIGAFSAEDGILSLSISLGTYDLTGKTVTASFSPRNVETELLSIVNGLIVIPIFSSYVKVGLNHIQLNIRKNDTLEQSPILTWIISESLPSTVPAQHDVDIITALIAQVTALDSVAEQAATDAATSATASAASAQSASDALSQLNSELNNTIPTLVDGKLNPSQIPAISIVSIVDVASTAQMIQLTPQQVQQGDICRIVVDGIITDTYSLGSSDPSVLSNWMKYGQGYVAEAGHAAGADTAGVADTIDGYHIAKMTQAEYDAAVKDASTIYFVV